MSRSENCKAGKKTAKQESLLAIQSRFLIWCKIMKRVRVMRFLFARHDNKNTCEENTVISRIYEKIKRIVEDLRFDPDDEPERKEAKHLLTLRRYIQFSVMLTGFFLIMSAVNIYQKSWAMFGTTFLGAVISCVFGIIGGCRKKEGIVAAGISVCLIIMFSFYALTGGNDGFAILWILLIPAAMPLMNFRSGMLVSSYFLIFLFLLFYSPISNLLQYEYGEIFCVRFPLLYAISYGISWFGYYKLHESKLQNYRHRQRLIELRQEADYANNAKSQFLANMSHEIRTPINGILGMDSILIRECKDEHLLEYARDIQSASQTLLSIVNDILDISKIESGKMEILPVQYELFSVINDCYNMIYFKAQDKKLELKLEINPCIPSELFGDEVRIRQIINNLLSNAVKYTQEGAVTLAMDFKEREGARAELIIQVKDTGIGIKQEDFEKLFESFQRLEEKRNRTIEGTGLGLNLTKRLIEMMGGTLAVESVYGEGSTFTARIPQEVRSGEQMGDFMERYQRRMVPTGQAKDSLTAPKARILVVDDVEMNLKVVKGLLRETKIQIDTAMSGKECLEWIQKQSYDMIFLDHMMPEMDGIETLQRMRRTERYADRAVPVIALTANAISGSKEMYLQAGFHDYLSKPVREEALLGMLRKYLRAELIEDCEETSNATYRLSDTSVNEPGAGETDETAGEGMADGLSRYEGILDTQTGMTYCMDDESFYMEMIMEYSAGDKTAKLQACFETEDWENYRILVHALKSTSLTIGAEELSKEAKELEAACREGNIAYVKEHHAETMERYQVLLDKIRRTQ